jgi:predicted nucleic acid-binding protein
VNNCFLDTNILIYSISDNPAEAQKRTRAIALLDRADCCLSVQVLQEFYVQATRPSRPGALPHEAAVQLMAAWMRFPVQDITIAILNAALEIKAKYGFSYWDSALVAAAQSLGCRELCTEDLSHGQVVDGLHIVNPFR